MRQLSTMPTGLHLKARGGMFGRILPLCYREVQYIQCPPMSDLAREGRLRGLLLRSEVTLLPKRLFDLTYPKL